jgi:hypothetical protein
VVKHNNCEIKSSFEINGTLKVTQHGRETTKKKEKRRKKKEDLSSLIAIEEERGDLFAVSGAVFHDGTGQKKGQRSGCVRSESVHVHGEEGGAVRGQGAGRMDE